LEAGSVATPFEFEDYSTTLGKCQRYYEKDGGDQGSQVFWSGNTTNTANYFAVKGFQVQKRAIPTMTLTNIGQGDFPAGTSATQIDTMGFRHARAANANGAGSYFLCSWIADSEL